MVSHREQNRKTPFRKKKNKNGVVSLSQAPNSKINQGLNQKNGSIVPD